MPADAGAAPRTWLTAAGASGPRNTSAEAASTRFAPCSARTGSPTRGCPAAAWPARCAPRCSPAAAAGAPAALVAGGRLETVTPVTPYHWVRKMARTLHSAVLLTREGVGHGSYGTTPCVNAAVDVALLKGALLADGTVCGMGKPAATRPRLAAGVPAAVSAGPMSDALA
ncbi:alpha/beta hydrolase [Streptomyces sp. 840.1]|uniref:alpha/beta hydrolase n=1 Tax=Streptomyces sp. 840.1 TaxID=2485152 RepID=UPI0021A36C82|nr:alpha/beta hydrolase [Streptomyces sp. 840.1]